MSCRAPVMVMWSGNVIVVAVNGGNLGLKPAFYSPLRVDFPAPEMTVLEKGCFEATMQLLASVL